MKLKKYASITLILANLCTLTCYAEEKAIETTEKASDKTAAAEPKWVQYCKAGESYLQKNDMKNSGLYMRTALEKTMRQSLKDSEQLYSMMEKALGKNAKPVVAMKAAMNRMRTKLK